MNSYLLFSIGPVQEFIAAGRKTQDLYAGSMLLSRLSFETVEFLKKELNTSTPIGEVIFPVSNRFDTTPNHIFARIKSDEAKRIAEDAEKKVKEIYDEIWKKVKDKFTSYESDAIWNEYWVQQNENFIEVYWAIYTPNEGELYGNIYKTTEILLGQRKLTRDFKELKFNENNLGQPNIKCSLLPSLSALHKTLNGEKNPHTEVKEFWKNLISDFPNKFRKNEKLSSVAIVKRFFLDEFGKSGFPSTRTIAAGEFYRNVCAKYNEISEEIINFNTEIGKLLTELGQGTNSSNFPSLESIKNGDPLQKFLKTDTDWLNIEEYNKEKIKDEYGKDVKEKTLNDARNSCKNLIDKLKEENIPPPGKYYAAILFDGDNMGKNISKCGNENEHKAISKKLSEFASKTCYNKIEGDSRLGKIIYSGGDDLMAFCSLEDLFDIIKDINKEFRELGLEGSMGVVISHYQTNLAQTLETLRESLYYSKEHLGRDAVTFSLLKRSGDRLSAGIKWGVNNENIDALKFFAGEIINKNISTSLIYSLHKEMSVFSDFPAVIVTSEIKRIMERQSNYKKNTEFENSFEKINLLFNNILKNYNIKSSDKYYNLTKLLFVAQFIGKGGN